MVEIIAAHSARTASFHLEDGWSTSDLWASATHLLWLLVCRCLLGPKKGGPHLSFDGHTYLLSLGSICHFSFFWLLTRSLTLDQAFSLDRCLSLIGGPCYCLGASGRPFEALPSFHLLISFSAVFIFWLSRHFSGFTDLFSPFSAVRTTEVSGKEKMQKNMQKEGGGS